MTRSSHETLSERRLRRLVRLAEAVSPPMVPEDFAKFLEEPNDLLEGLRPWDLIISDESEFERVLSVIQAAVLKGNDDPAEAWTARLSTGENQRGLMPPCLSEEEGAAMAPKPSHIAGATMGGPCQQKPIGDAVPETAARIASAAVELFSRKGYAATSIREIVEAVGVTKPSLYYYFGSKEGLYLYLLHSGEILINRLLSEVSQAEGTPRTKIEHLCLGLARFARENAPLIRMIEASYRAPSDGAPQGNVASLHDKIREQLCTLLKEGRRQGVFRFTNVDDVAELLSGIFYVALPYERWPRLGSHPMPDEVRLLNLIFDGILGCPEDGPASSERMRRGKGLGAEETLPDGR